MSDTFLEITPSVAADNTPDALRSEVLRRMEVYVLEALIDTLALRQASPTTQNSSSPDRCDHQDAALRCPSVLPRAAMPLRVLHTARNRLLVLAVVFANVLRRTVQTQRDVYYHLVREVPAQAVVNRTVLQLARALRVPRELMGVTAGGRGFIAGALFYHGTSLEGPTFALEGMPLPLLEADLCVACVKELDESESCTVRTAAAPHCRHVDQPEKINADTNDDDDDTSRRGFFVSPNVRFILVIEKHAVFSHLLRGGLLRRVPCVLLTAQGCPTHAAHRLLANLHAALPQAAVVGLVDYNPHGLAILSAYRWPSSSFHEDSDAVQPAGVVRRRACAMPENRFCAVPALRWLGVRAAQVRRVEEVARRNADGSAMRFLRPAAEDVRRESLVGGEAPLLAAASVSVVEESDRLQATDAASSLFRPVPEPPRVVLPPLQPLFSRDAVVLDNLIKQLETRLRGVAVVEGNRQCGLNDTDSSSVRAWLREAQEMRRHGVKCELEVLYTTPFAALFCGTAPLSAFASTSQDDGDASLMTSTSQSAAAAFVAWVAHQLLRGHFV